MIIGTVPYINSLPLTHYLPEAPIKMAPSELSLALLYGKVDVALVPVYTIIRHKLRMHPDVGIIGCDGPIGSVGLFTRSYIEDLGQIRSVYLDKESLSSVYLTKIILKKFYNISLYDLEFFHHDNREMADAQLLIGDKALFFDKNKYATYKFWDLGAVWKQHTDAGFMFACWASKRALTPAEIAHLRQAGQKGLKHRRDIAMTFPPDQREFIENYLTKNVVYEATPAIKEGLKLYKEFLAEYRYNMPLKKKVA